MITFEQMEQNMAVFGCECPNHLMQPMTHLGITTPVIDQLADYYAAGENVLLTPRELIKLAAVIRCQSVKLDEFEEAEPSNGLTDEPSRGRRIAGWLALTFMVVGVIDTIATVVHLL